MGKYIVSVLVGASFLAGVASADSLSELKGLENIGSGSSQHSPSQVVILNHTPNQSQDQNTESLNSSSQRYKARAGWGTGESLEALRDSRINKEAKNEQVLMEKLEHSRMEDEKSRLRRLFKLREYNRRRHAEMGEDDYEFGSIEQDYEASHRPVHGVQKAVTVVHAPTVGVASVTPDLPSTSSGRTSWLPSSNPYNGKALYIKGQLGFGNYSASNATSPIGTASWGLSAGKHVNSRWLVEFGVYKTSYEIDDPRAAVVGNYDIYGNQGVSQVRTLDQYNFSGLVGFKAVKYNGILGTLRGGLSYVRRDSESLDLPGYQALRTNTIDGLIGLGVDVEVAENIMITASLDYYSNLLNDISSTDTGPEERIETAGYSVLGLGLKFKF